MVEIDKRKEYSERLKSLSMHMYNAMSQGGNNRIFVNPEMAEDILAASYLVNSASIVWNEAIDKCIEVANKYDSYGPAYEMRMLKK